MIALKLIPMGAGNIPPFAKGGLGQGGFPTSAVEESLVSKASSQTTNGIILWYTEKVNNSNELFHLQSFGGCVIIEKGVAKDR